MFERYIRWLLSHPWQAIVLAGALLGALLPGLRHLGFDQDYRVFFAQEFPPLKALENLHATYNKNDNLLIVLAPAGGDVFTQEALAIVRQATEQAWRLPYAVRVESITNYQHTYARHDELVIDDFVRDPTSLTASMLAELKRIALRQPELRDRLISSDGAVTGVNVVIELPDSTEEASVIMARARELAHKLEAENPGLGVYLTGIIPMNHAFPEASMEDMSTLVPAMYGVIVLLLAILLRSLWGTIATIVVITCAVIAALGASGHLGIRLTPPSASTPTMIMTIALADCIHLLTYLFHDMRRGIDRHAALANSVRANMHAMFLTSSAAAIGFLSMNMSESPPFRDLGNITALGIAAAFIFSSLLLPAMMRLLPVSSAAGRSGMDRLMDDVAGFVVTWRRPLGAFVVAAVVGLGACIPGISLNDEWIKYFDESFEFRRDTEFAANRLTGIYTIEYSIPASGDGGIAEPEYLQNLDSFVSWYRAQPKVRHVSAITDALKRANRSVHGDDDHSYTLPQSRAAGSELLMLYELSMPYGHGLNTMINAAKSASRVVVSLDVVSAVEMKQIEQAAETWLRTNAPSYMLAHGASPTLMFTHISQRNIRQMLGGTAIALVLISGVLVYALRSAKLGAISLLPNLVPAVLGFGLWGLLVGEVGLATSIVAGMTLGIVVDDTIHFLSKYRRARIVHDASPEEAVRYAFRTVGSAMLVTTTVLVAGFLVLGLSTFEMNSGMGLLTAITLSFALVADFTLLPILLLTFDRGATPSVTRLSIQPQENFQ